MAVVAGLTRARRLGILTDDMTSNYGSQQRAPAWTTGVANNNRFFNTGVTASTPNGATATYAYLHQVSGKMMRSKNLRRLVPSQRSYAQRTHHAGRDGFNHCGSLEPS